MWAKQTTTRRDDTSVYWTSDKYKLQDIIRTVSSRKHMIILRQQLPKQQQHTRKINDTRHRRILRDRSGSVWRWMFSPAETKLKLSVLRCLDALEQVGVAVGSSSAVAELPNARSELHGAAVTHPTLAGGEMIKSRRKRQRTKKRLTSLQQISAK